MLMLPFLAQVRLINVADKTGTSTGSPSTRNTDGEEEDSDDVTIHNGTKSVVVHHGKSSGSDMSPFVVPVVAIFFVFTWLIIKTLMAPFSQRAGRRGGTVPAATGQGLTEEEQAVLLKLQRTLAQMERRIESLETILIDQNTKEKYGTKL